MLLNTRLKMLVQLRRAFSFYPKPKLSVHCILITLLSLLPSNQSTSFTCSKFEFVVFDSYGTLIDVNSLVNTAERVVTSTNSTSLVNLWRTKQLDYTWMRSLMKSPLSDSYKDFWEVTQDALKYSLEKLDISLEQSKQDELMNGWLQLSIFPEVREALTEIKKNHQIAVLSNGAPKMLSEVFKHNGLNDLINSDNEISVDDIKVFKPHPSVYALAESRLRVPKSKILFVSGNDWDVIGAKSYGFHSIWINRKNEPKENLGFAADFEFPDLNQLSAHISQSHT